MPSICRLQWLTSQIHMGRSAHVSFSFNASTGVEKIKFTLDSAFTSRGVFRPVLFGALLAAQHALDTSITTDKGHKSSAGCTVVEFWCKQPPLERIDAATEIVMNEIMEVTPMPPSDGASLLASGITFDSVPDVASVAPGDHATDLARHAELTMHDDGKRYDELTSLHATLTEKLRTGIEKYKILERLSQSNDTSHHDGIKDSISNLYAEQYELAEQMHKVHTELCSLSARLHDRALDRPG